MNRIRKGLSAAIVPLHAAVGLMLTIWIFVGALELAWLVGTGRGEDPHGYVLLFVGAPMLGVLLLVGVPLAGLILGVSWWRSGRGAWLLVLADVLVVGLGGAFLSLDGDMSPTWLSALAGPMLDGDVGPGLSALAGLTLGFALAAFVVAAVAQRSPRVVGWRSPSD